MSKRFIDTGIFDDDWFMDLSKDAKLLWIYLITKCDHAGMIKVNEKLCRLQTDIKDIRDTIKQLGNRLVTVSELFYFIPKYIEFQYPGFPNSKVRQQSSAVDILIKHNLFDREKQTVTKELNNSYVNVIDNGNVIVNVINVPFSDFWNLYDKKRGDISKLEKKWIALSDAEREAIMEYIPRYKTAEPDKQYRKDPATFLNNKSWNDEIIGGKNGKQTTLEDFTRDLQTLQNA